MSEKSDQIAGVLRRAILRGDYQDGEHLSQAKLALKYGVHRSVVINALHLLEFEGFVSQDIERSYHANASYQTRQVQMVITMLDHIKWQCELNVVRQYGYEYTSSPGRQAMVRKIRDRRGRISA